MDKVNLFAIIPALIGPASRLVGDSAPAPKIKAGEQIVAVGSLRAFGLPGQWIAETQWSEVLPSKQAVGGQWPGCGRQTRNK